MRLVRDASDHKVNGKCDRKLTTLNGFQRRVKCSHSEQAQAERIIGRTTFKLVLTNSFGTEARPPKTPQSICAAADLDRRARLLRCLYLHPSRSPQEQPAQKMRRGLNITRYYFVAKLSCFLIVGKKGLIRSLGKGNGRQFTFAESFSPF